MHRGASSPLLHTDRDLTEGQVQAGDALELLLKHPDGLTVADVASLYTTERGNIALLKKAISATALPESWSGYFEHQLERLEG